MTDLREQLARLLDDEPAAPYDIERIVSAGRRARRRRNVVVATASSVGAAGLTAAVVVPIVASSGNEAAVRFSSKPSSTPTPAPSTSTGNCYLIAATSPKAEKLTVARLIKSGKVEPPVSVTPVNNGKSGNKDIFEVCSVGATPPQPGQDKQAPAGPPYHYTEDPAAIATRLGDHLHKRVADFGLTITYTRPFSQESTKPDSGHPTYFGGNVDVHETNGYADIGVQVTHETTELVPFDGDCTGTCQMTKLPDGSILRTDQVKAGRGDTVVTAEVHRKDGVVVQAQMSNYPFGPDAGSQAHGHQPLSLDQLVSLATDANFTF